MFGAALDSLRSSLPSLPTLPNFDLSLFKPNDEDELLYIEDNLSEKQNAVLEKLLDSLSIENFLTFISNIPSLISLGQQTNPIHPFNTFEFFLSTNDRIEKTKKIYHKTGVQLGFEHFKTQSIKGFAYFLEKRHKKDELLPHLDEFCAKTRKDKTLLKSLIDAGDFDKFVEEVLVNF